MECLNCGAKITEGKLCDDCADKKNRVKHDIKIKLVLMIFAICVFFLSVFLSAIINIEIIQKALSRGVAVSTILMFFATTFTMVKSYLDYKHYCRLEKKNNIQITNTEDGEINEDALQRYLSNRKNNVKD